VQRSATCVQIFTNYSNTRSWEFSTLFSSTLRVAIDIFKTSNVQVPGCARSPLSVSYIVDWLQGTVFSVWWYKIGPNEKDNVFSKSM